MGDWLFAIVIVLAVREIIVSIFLKLIEDRFKQMDLRMDAMHTYARLSKTEAQIQPDNILEDIGDDLRDVGTVIISADSELGRKILKLTQENDGGEEVDHG